VARHLLGKQPESEHQRAGELTLAEVLGGDQAQTPSGVAVTPATALRLSAVWACIRLLADTVSTLPLDTYRAGSREPVDKPAILTGPAAGMDFGEWVWCLLYEALTSPPPGAWSPTAPARDFARRSWSRSAVAGSL
jgi:hypothetical protein